MGTGSDNAVGVNKLRLKLREAGLPLKGLKYKVGKQFWEPEGFEFTCQDPDQDKLLNMAVRNRKFGPNDVGLPNHDPWREAGIASLGFSQRGVYNYLHLDIASDPPERQGLCRVYIAPESWGKWREAIEGPPSYLHDEVYLTIAKRLATLGITIGDHIDTMFEVGGTTLDGITFSPRAYRRLADAVEDARRANGQTFIEGKNTGSPDAIDLSFLATSGRGFREITWRDGASATLDFSALHLALSPLRCNIHIDEFGVVVGGPDGQMSLSPNALHHIANELVLKSIIKEFLHDKLGISPWYIDHLFVELPNTSNTFSRFGVGVEARPWRSVKVTASYTCGIGDERDCRKMFSLVKSF